MVDWWTDPGILTSILTFLGIVAFFGGFFRWLYKWTRTHDRKHDELAKLPSRLEKLEIDTSSVRDDVSALLVHTQTRDPTFLDTLKALGLRAAGNPYDPERRADLIEKYRKGTITLDEARELLAYLQEDATTQSTATTVSGVTGVAALVYLLSQRKVTKSDESD
jgi:hypothetical protein